MHERKRQPSEISSAETKEKPSNHWQTRSLLHSINKVVGWLNMEDLQEAMTDKLKEAKTENSFHLTFFDLRFKADGEFLPPRCQVSYMPLAWYNEDERPPFKINFLYNPYPQDDEATKVASYMGSHELSRFKDKVKSILTQNKVNYEYGYDYEFSFKTEKEFFKALNVLAKEDLMPEMPVSVAELSKQYQDDLQAALAELNSKKEEAFSIYDQSDKDAIFSRYMVAIEHYKKSIMSVANKEKGAIENLLKLTDSPFLAIFIENSRANFIIDIKKTAINRLFTAFETIFCPEYNKYNYPSGFETLLELKNMGDIQATAVLDKALATMTYEQFMDFFRHEKEGKISKSTTTKLLELNSRHIETLIDSKEKLEALEAAIKENKRSAKLQAWFVEFSRVRFKTQVAALAQSRLPVSLVKHAMTFLSKDTKADVEKMSKIVDAAAHHVDTSEARIKAAKARETKEEKDEKKRSHGPS